MSLQPYQKSLDLNSNQSDTPAGLVLYKKRVISAYFAELEARMWHKFAQEKWTKDEDIDKARTKEIVIELSKEINKEWNDHRAATNNDHMPHNGFIQLASIVFDFPIKLVPIMK